ncbi:MAG: glycosyltransferase family 9 protein [Parachlamydiales bacterium]|nr:glycosyltransferase family 9 protein [Parachlamydiales bacterium]
MTSNILIVKIGAIGDVIMATTMLTWIQKHKPGSKVTWMCGKTVLPLLQSIKGIDRIICIDEEKLLKGSKFSQISEVLKANFQIFNQCFDLVITPYHDKRYQFLSSLCRAKDRRSFGTTAHRKIPVPSRYHEQEYCRLISNEDGPYSSWTDFPEINLPTITSSTSNIFLCPGGAKNMLADTQQRRWPIEYYVKLAGMLVDQGLTVSIVGAKSDEWVIPYFNLTLVQNFVGQLSLLELVGHFKNSLAVVTHDSGPLHIAKLVKAKTVALFGPTNPHEFARPTSRLKVLWGGEHLPCRPCYDGKNFFDCPDVQCMKSITPDQVFQTLQSLINNI